VQPGAGGYFQYSLVGGAGTSGQVVVTNLSKAPATYELYAAQATTAPTSGVAYGQPSSAGQGDAPWVHLAVTQVELAPGAHQAVAFTVTVPPGTHPGQHVTAVVAASPEVSQAPASSAAGSSVALVVTSRVIVAIVVTVPGAAAAGVHVGRPRVEAQQHVRQEVLIPMANTGDLLVKPHLTGTIAPCNGAAGPQATIDRQLTTFVPHTAIAFPWYLSTALAAGCYRAALELSARTPNGVAVTSRFTGDVWINSAQVAITSPSATPRLPFTLPAPLAVADAAALGLAVLGFGYVVLRRRTREDRSSTTS